MAIRNLYARVVARLKERAVRMERRELAAQIRKKLANRQHGDSTVDIAEDRRR